ncbi:MAG: hypothetical protein ACRDRO_15415 [Pseudonocardiaceae bacterium]
MITDRAAAYPRVIEELFPAAYHVTGQYGVHSVLPDPPRMRYI